MKPIVMLMKKTILWPGVQHKIVIGVESFRGDSDPLKAHLIILYFAINLTVCKFSSVTYKREQWFTPLYWYGFLANCKILFAAYFLLIQIFDRRWFQNSLLCMYAVYVLYFMNV